MSDLGAGLTPPDPRIDLIAAALWQADRFSHEPQWDAVPERHKEPWRRYARTAVHALDRAEKEAAR